MNYKNSVCDGCGLPFKEDDDVVVCPECGTPQHRECYKLNNQCVNAHKHGESFDWSGAPTPTADVSAQEAKAEEKLPCPSCGHLNDKDAKRCENCSMRLIVFGMNLAENPGVREAENPTNQNTSDYPPPFTLGQGEGFGYVNSTPAVTENGVPEEPEEVKQLKQRNARNFIFYRFIGSNTEKYFANFNRIANGQGLTFNFAAFFFTPYWFFYRKLYKPGIIFLTLFLLFSILFAPTLAEFEAIFEAYCSAIADNPAPDEAAITALIKELDALMPMLSLNMFCELALRIVSGLIAYPLYKKYADKSVDRIMSAPSAEAGIADTVKLGGTSVAAVLVAFAAMYAVSLAAGMILGQMM